MNTYRNHSKYQKWY